MGYIKEKVDKNKVKTMYAEVKNIIDVTTGELVSQKSKLMKTMYAEADFLKVHLNTVWTF